MRIAVLHSAREFERKAQSWMIMLVALLSKLKILLKLLREMRSSIYRWNLREVRNEK